MTDKNFDRLLTAYYVIIVAFLVIAIYILLTPRSATINNNDRFIIIEKDSCEYIVYKGCSKGGITHKGNCKYCKTRNK